MRVTGRPAPDRQSDFRLSGRAAGSWPAPMSTTDRRARPPSPPFSTARTMGRGRLRQARHRQARHGHARRGKIAADRVATARRPHRDRDTAGARGRVTAPRTTLCGKRVVTFWQRSTIRWSGASWDIVIEHVNKSRPPICAAVSFSDLSSRIFSPPQFFRGVFAFCGCLMLRPPNFAADARSESRGGSLRESVPKVSPANARVAVGPS